MRVWVGSVDPLGGVVSIIAYCVFPFLEEAVCSARGARTTLICKALPGLCRAFVAVHLEHVLYKNKKNS